MLEFVCIMWFIIEYILRLTAAPKKGQFLKGAMNFIDLMSFLPFFISLIPAEAFAEFKQIRRPIGVFRYAISINLIFVNNYILLYFFKNPEDFTCI